MRRFDRPIVWGLLYLLMIPAFALVYGLAAGSFYQTSATHEPSYLDNEFKVEEAVAQGASRNVSSQALHNKCRTCVLLKTADGLNVTANGTDLLVTIGFPTETNTGDVTVQVDIPEDSLPSPYDTAGGFVYLPYSTISTANTIAGEGSSASLQLFEQYTNTKINPDMPIASAEMASIQQLADAAQGTVGGLPDQFLRMLYFSAVSATTLGFGDIVPVTAVSRSLVTFEAVLGVVFIGLFLNALARRGPDAWIRTACTTSPTEPEGQPRPST